MRSPTTFPLWTLVLATALSGCALQRARVAREAEVRLIGMSETELLECAGAPASARRSGKLNFFTYHGGGDAIVAYARSELGIYRRRYCDATFTLRDGQVTALQYRGRTGGLLSGDEQCAFIVEDCLGR